jgi:hypothetical protein
MHLQRLQDAASYVPGLGRAGTAARFQTGFGVTTGRHTEGLTATDRPEIAIESPAFTATTLGWSSVPVVGISHCASALGGRTAY